MVADKKEYIPSSLATPPTGGQNQDQNQYFSYHDGIGQGRSNSMGGRSNLTYGSDLKGR